MSEDNPSISDNDENINSEDTTFVDTSVMLEDEKRVGIDENVVKQKKSEMEFSSLGIITIWIFPAIVAGLFVTVPGLWVLLAISSIVYKLLLENRKIPLFTSFIDSFGNAIFRLSRLSSATTSMSQSKDSIRIWWFVLFGSLITTFIGGIILALGYTILPILLILYKRKAVIRYMYILTYAPKREYVFMTSIEERQKKKEMKEELSHMEKGYFYFRGPKRMTTLVSYLLIFLTPFALILILVPVTLVTIIAAGNFDQVPDTFFGEIVSGGIEFAVIGLIAIIPYVLLDLRIWKSLKLTRLSTLKLAPRLISALSANKLSFGLFSGEYYIEEDAMMLDMSESTGFFAIFKNGRLFSIIVTPLAFISILFRFILQSGNISDTDNITTSDFLGRFIDSINILNNTGSERVAGMVMLGLIIIAPIILSIILPMIWVISDSELKRATWYYNEVDEGYTYEINDVENVGKSILNTFKIVLGVGAISALATNISIILENSSFTNGWLITAVVIIIGSVMTLPGTFYMTYKYLASGDHAKGVNIIRFSGSQKPDIGVGTISRNYKLEYKLLNPPEEIRHLIGEDYMQSIEEISVHDTEEASVK